MLCVNLFFARVCVWNVCLGKSSEFVECQHKLLEKRAVRVECRGSRYIQYPPCVFVGSVVVLSVASRISAMPRHAAGAPAASYAALRHDVGSSSITCDARPPWGGIPKHPQPPPKKRQWERALKDAMVANVVQTRKPREMAMQKPMPMRYTPDITHVNNCTLCANQAAVYAATRSYSLNGTSGSPHLLIDDAALDAWKDVVIELEGPRKNVATFGLSRSPDAPPKPLNHLKRWHFWPRGGFGMPGTVLHEDGKFRAWLGQSTQRYFESTDGLHFDQPVNPQTGQIREVQWSPLSARGRSQMGEHGASFQSPREVAQDTFTLMRDDSMPDRSASSERYKAALTCDDLGHTPYPKFREHRRMGRISRTVWTEAPIFRGKRHHTWESTCLAHSRDGFRWRLYDLGHHRAEGPEPLRLASDTANALYRDFITRDIRIVNRWAAALPKGRFGTSEDNPNWWREVRGVRISSARNLKPSFRDPKVDSDAAQVHESVRWIFDKEGKDEHLRRQTYSLQVTPLEEEGVFIGLLNVLEWPKMINPNADEPPFEYDTMQTYLATSRDGVHFDTDWVYAQQELIPRGGCQDKPYCIRLRELSEDVAKSGSAPLEELCCSFDQGMIIPASSMLTVDSGDGAPEHVIYYEGRPTFHEGRYSLNAPMGLGVASWRHHRLAGVRRDPSAAGGDRCGVVLTKPIYIEDLVRKSGVTGESVAHASPAQIYFTVNVGFADDQSASESGRGGAESNMSTSALFAEVVLPCGSAEAHSSVSPRFLRTHSLARSIPVLADSSAAVLRWRPSGKRGDERPISMLQTRRPSVALRFTLCGSAKLFAFSASVATRDAPLSESEGAATIRPASTTHRFEVAAKLREERIRSRARRRAKEMMTHNVSYGRCSATVPLHPIPMGTTEWVQSPSQGFTNWHSLPPCAPTADMCAFSMAAPPDTTNADEPRLDQGVTGCKYTCEKMCFTCHYASMSWSAYKCICYTACPKLAVSQLVDDAYPSLMEQMESIPALGGGADPVFDWVSFPLGTGALPPEGLRGRDGVAIPRRFPRALWNTTLQWAEDWVGYTATLSQHGVRPSTLLDPPSEWKSSLGVDGVGQLLDSDGQAALGLKEGFCAPTDGPANCRTAAKGAVKLSLLTADLPKPVTWKHAAQRCTQMCNRCQNCHFITLSLQADDCSWYSKCNLRTLSHDFQGFYSARVRK